MKKTLITLVAMVMVMGSVMTAHAKTTAYGERNVNRFIYEIEDDYDEEDEEFKEIIQIDMEYIDLGHDLYDVTIMYIIYDNPYEYHVLYDGFEDEAVIEYGIWNGVRVDSFTFEEYLEELYPELMDL